MLNFNRSLLDSKEKFISCYWGPLVSKTINIFANAANSSLCVSSARLLRQRPFPSLNTPSRILNLEGFSWQKGYRNPLAFVSYKKSYQKFLEALHLCLCVRQRGGNIHVIFDEDQFLPQRDGLQVALPFMDQGQYKMPFGTSSNTRQVRPFFGFVPLRGNPQRGTSFATHALAPKGRAPLGHGQGHGHAPCNKTHDFSGDTTFSAKNSKTGRFLVLPVPKRQQRNRCKEKPTFLNSKNLDIKTSTPICFTNIYKIKKNFDTNYNWSGDKWVGGTFSNYKQISKSIHLYKTISRQFLEILENQTSSRYLGMANKFHGILGSTEPRKNKHNVFHGRKATERPRGNLKLMPFQGSLSSTRAYGQPFQGMSGVNHVSIGKGSPKRQNQATEKQDHYYSQKSPKLSIFNEILKNNTAKNLRNINLPDLVIIENAEKYKNVIAEAHILKIPVIAFVESNTLSNISIALPLNSLKHYFLAFLLQTISKTPSFS